MTEQMTEVEKGDLICVGAGIMSATLALMVKMIDPSKKVTIFERLDAPALESSGAWNNSGTGHSGLCELNYTPEDDRGNIDISKAKEICRQFETSRQFWSYLVETGRISDPQSFVRQVPHHTWVHREADVDYLRRRYEAMKNHFVFEDMEFTRSRQTMQRWFPLVVDGRDHDENMAATRMARGTEIDFGALTRHYLDILDREFGVKVRYLHHVEDIDPERSDWTVRVKNTDDGSRIHCDARHVFIGAGGGALLLLEKVEIPERKNYGGFPVSGKWLVCKNRAVAERHHAKVYGKAGPDAPPMSTPHLDTRYIGGRRELMFGPFAGFSPKFLKEGSRWDLPSSINWSNIPAMWGVFWHRLPLTKYLLGQLTMSHKDRMEELREFIPDAKAEDWELRVAGQRVQVIKRDREQGGVLEFGTEVVSGAEGTITALLGASPGASTAVEIMLGVLDRAFPDMMDREEARDKLRRMIPTRHTDILNDRAAFREALRRSQRTLFATNLS